MLARVQRRSRVRKLCARSTLVYCLIFESMCNTSESTNEYVIICSKDSLTELTINLSLPDTRGQSQYAVRATQRAFTKAPQFHIPIAPPRDSQTPPPSAVQNAQKYLRSKTIQTSVSIPPPLLSPCLNSPSTFASPFSAACFIHASVLGPFHCIAPLFLRCNCLLCFL